MFLKNVIKLLNYNIGVSGLYINESFFLLLKELKNFMFFFIVINENGQNKGVLYDHLDTFKSKFLLYCAFSEYLDPEPNLIQKFGQLSS